MRHGSKFPIGCDVPIDGRLHGGMAHGNEPIGDVYHFGIAEGFSVEGEGEVTFVGTRFVKEADAGLDSCLFLFDGVDGLLRDLLGGSQYVSPGGFEGLEHFLVFARDCCDCR